MTRRDALMRRLARDERGSAVLEFAFATPIFILFVWGFFQTSLLMMANAGVQNALGDGARYATLYVPATGGPPSDDQIKAKIISHKFGVGNGTWTSPTITTDAINGTKTITVSYSQPTNFLFFKGPTVTVTKSKLVHSSLI